MDLVSLKNRIPARFLKFLVVGTITTTADFAVFGLLHFTAGMGVVWANILSYGTGTVLSFFLNRAWTFADTTRRSNKLLILNFVVAYIGLVVNTAIVWFLVQYVHAYVAKVLAVIVVLFYNYLMNKHVIFKVK